MLRGYRHCELIQFYKGMRRYPAGYRREGFVRTQSAVEQAALRSLNEGHSEGHSIEYELKSDRGKEAATNLRV
jgi:cold shock CspA family protein